MAVRRRISATYKDLPGGQVLGPSYDYTHRLLDFALAAEDGVGEPQAACAERPVEAAVPRVTDILNHEGLIEEEIALNDEVPVGDLTREPLRFPAGRDLRLQDRKSTRLNSSH